MIERNMALRVTPDFLASSSRAATAAKGRTAPTGTGREGQALSILVINKTLSEKGQKTQATIWISYGLITI
jgi:hypothetical protein